jgi:tRNA wybutosine-synthesizing protein 1
VRTGQARFGLTMRSQSLEDYDFESELHRESAVVVIVPTYDNGTPNATTKDFYDYLKECEHDFRVSKQLLERTSFAVFGLGDTVYGDNFCVVARRIDEWLKGLGGNRMLARGAGDAQYSTKQFETWMGRLWPSLLAALGEKGKLAALRNELKSQKKASALKFAYVSDEENEDKEPLADVEDLDVKKVEGGEDGDDDDDSVEETLEYGKQLLTPSLRTALSKQGYQLIGSHSGVKLCRWTKAMLRGRGGCYKHTFYNITSYACMEMTPSLACANK